MNKKNIIVNGYAYPFIETNTLEKTLPYLTFLTIFSYHIKPDGSLTFIEDENLIAQAKTQNTMPIMAVTNMDENGFDSELIHNILSNNEVQNTLINNILEVAMVKNYYGVNIDFEYISPDDKNLYNEFIRKISNILHQNNFILITSLAPKSSENQPGILYEAHDYKFHGKYADYIILMTYEWGYSYGPPMAVAPLNQVEKVVRYAVKEIPSEKTLMGIPNYGYDWKLPYEKGTKAESLGNEEAINLAISKQTPIEFDEIAMAPYFYYDNNSHIVWFEDARSISAKLNLVDKYNLAGVSYWNINKWFTQNYMILNVRYNIYKI